MKKYKISKIQKNYNNTLCNMSTLGDSRKSFTGISLNPPTIGERFRLEGVISTSPIVSIEDDIITTTYSVYSIIEVE